VEIRKLEAHSLLTTTPYILIGVDGGGGGPVVFCGCKKIKFFIMTQRGKAFLYGFADW
jgi:hypothetical protein